MKISCLDRIIHNLKIVGIGLGLWLAIPLSLQAATYYVSTTGSDSNPGTIDQPFLTLFKATGTWTTGDTILVMPGTYAEGLNNRFASGTSWSNPNTIRAFDPNNRPILKPNSGTDRVLNFATSSSLGTGRQYIIIDGFVLDGTNINSDVVKIQYSGADATKGANHIRIMNSEIKNGPSNGILITSINSGYNEFINLDVHDNGVNQLDHGFYISTSNNVVENSRVYNNAGYGIHVYSENSWTADNNVIKNSLLFNNARYGYTGSGVILSSGTGNIAYNNIIFGNNSGIRVNYGAMNTKVYNNTVYANNRNEGLPKPGGGTVFNEGNVVIGDSAGFASGLVSDQVDFANNIVSDHIRYGIYSYTAATNVTIRNNFFYNNGTDIRPGSATATNNITDVPPEYENPASWNFSIRSTSQAINRGLTLSDVTTDYYGTARPYGEAYDIGAHEYIPGPNRSTSDGVLAPACGDVVPGGKGPWLYGAIPQDSSSVLLYFTESDDPVTRYSLVYGTKSGSYQFGTDNMGGKGMRTYLVKSLKPSTTYYFKVRAQNGCQPGPWSNEISVKTHGLISINTLDMSASTPATPTPVTPQPSAPIPSVTPPTVPALLPFYDVRITVVYPDLSPVTGAKVLLYSTAREAITDENGVATFRGVEGGEHQVVVSHQGYKGEGTVNLTGGNTKDINFTLKVEKSPIHLSKELMMGIGGGIISIMLAIVLLRKKS